MDDAREKESTLEMEVVIQTSSRDIFVDEEKTFLINAKP